MKLWNRWISLWQKLAMMAVQSRRTCSARSGKASRISAQVRSRSCSSGVIGVGRSSAR